MWQSWLFKRNASTAADDAAADATTDNAIDASNAVYSKEYVIWIT